MAFSPPFGMLMPERSVGSANYRYFFNGMEQDNEVSGNGNSYTTEFRQYDPRLGRWKSLDPLMGMFPWMSPYVAFDNNPIYYTDPLGLEGGPAKKGRTKYESGTTSGGPFCSTCNTTRRETRKTKGIGGDLHIPDSYNTSIGYYTGRSSYTEQTIDDNTKKVMLKYSFEGEVGDVYSFIGHDKKKYKAKWKSNGKFDGYYNGKTKYINEKVTAKNILDKKITEFLEYFKAGVLDENGEVFDPPSMNYHKTVHASSFTVKNETFQGEAVMKGSSDFHGTRGDLTVQEMELTNNDGYFQQTSSGGYKVKFYTIKKGAELYHRHDEFLTITFTDYFEYKRFVQFMFDNYDINDEFEYFVPDNTVFPTDIIDSKTKP